MTVNSVPGWKNVWITGASSGIGYELACLMAARADHVAISARRIEKLDALAGIFENVISHPLDVRDEKAVADTIAQVETTAGAIDLAVLNAGAWQWMSAKDFDLDLMRNMFEVNYMGVVNALSVLVPRMIERGHGHIAIVASVSGYRGLNGAAAYGPTKAALINLAETLKLELEPKGVSISLVNPGFVDTPMTQVNKFPMPDIIPASKAAKQLLKGLERRDYEIVFPQRFVRKMKILQLMPNRLYFWFVRKFIMRP